MADAFDHVDQLCAWLASTDIGLLELKSPTRTLRLLHEGTTVAVQTVDEADAIRQQQPALLVRASAPGAFLCRHPLRERAIIAIGEEFHAGDPLGFLQVGPLLLPVVAPLAGAVTNVLARHGTIVGYGAPLFELQPGIDKEP
jgi:acetyl-CoA carboxylase biotin carboxyl carrier protein